MRNRVLWLAVMTILAALIVPEIALAQQDGAIAGEVTDADLRVPTS